MIDETEGSGVRTGVWDASPGGAKNGRDAENEKRRNRPRESKLPPSKSLCTSAGALSTQQTAKSAPATAWAMEALRGGWAVRAAPREAIPPRAKTSKSRRTYRHVLVPLPVAAHDVVALLLEPLREVRRDEAARAGDADLQLLLGPVRLGAVNPAQFVAGGGHLKLVLRLATSR